MRKTACNIGYKKWRSNSIIQTFLVLTSVIGILKVILTQSATSYTLYRYRAFKEILFLIKIKIMRILKVIIGVLFMTNTAFSQINKDLMLSKEQAIEDIQFYFDTIRNVHPFPFYYSSENLFDSILYDIKTKLPDSLSANDFFKLLEYNTNSIFDGHTGIPYYSYSLNTIPQNSSLFPLEIFLEREKIYFKDKKLSKEILKINGVESCRIIREMTKLLKADFPISVRKNYIEEYFKEFYFSLYGSHENFTINYIDMKQPKTKNLKGILKQNIIKENETQENNDSFVLDVFREDSIALMTVNTFSYENKDHFEHFLQRSFDTIAKLKISTLFIDIRGNGGGSDILVNTLLDYIFIGDYKIMFGYVKRKGKEYGLDWTRKSLPQNIFTGNVIVLQSNQTASAAMDFSSAIKTSERGLIIGMETRDPAYSFSNSRSFMMPNSKLPFSCATGFFAMPGASFSGKNGIVPDIIYDVEKIGVINTQSIKNLYKMAIEKCKMYFEKEYFN